MKYTKKEREQKTIKFVILFFNTIDSIMTQQTQLEIAAKTIKSFAISEAIKLNKDATDAADRVKQTATLATNDLLVTASTAANQLLQTANTETLALKRKASDSATDLSNKANELAQIQHTSPSETAHLKEVAVIEAKKIQQIADDTAVKLKQFAKIVADKMPDQQLALFQIILNSIQNGIYVIDMYENIIFFNNETVSLLGPQNAGEPIKARVKDYGFYLPDQKTPWPVEQLPLVRVINTGNANGGIMFIKNSHKPEGIWITNFAYPKRKKWRYDGCCCYLERNCERIKSGLAASGIKCSANSILSLKIFEYIQERIRSHIQ